MKVFSNLILVSILVAFSGMVFAGENVYKTTDNEELFGTWVNMNYTGGMPPQMVIFKHSEAGYYMSPNDKEPMWKAEVLLSHKWSDAKGNIWYKSQFKALMDSGFSLIKISNSGATLESIHSQWEYPKDLDANSGYYRVYYRK